MPAIRPSPDNACNSWLLSRLEFTGDWAMPLVPTLVAEGMARGFSRGAIKDALSEWLDKHRDLVAPVTLSERMITYGHW